MSLEWIETEVTRFIEPLAEAAESVHVRRTLLLELGIDFDEAKALASAQEIVAGLEAAVAALRTIRDGLREPPSGFAEWRELLTPLVDEIKGIVAAGGEFKDAVDGLAKLTPEAVQRAVRDLAHLLVYRWLSRYHPVAFNGLLLLGVIEATDAAGVPFRVNPRQLRALLRDPSTAMADLYRKGALAANGARALTVNQRPAVVAARTMGLLGGAGLDIWVAEPGPEHAAIPILKDASYLVGGTWSRTLADPDVSVKLALSVLLGLLGEKPEGQQIKPIEGLVLGAAGEETVIVPLGAGWQFRQTAAAAAALLTFDARGLTLVGQGAGAVAAAVERPSPRDQPNARPIFRVGAETGTRLELWGASLELGVTTQPDVSVATRVEDLCLVLDPGDGDGFLADALKAAKIAVDVDLGLLWSQRKGLKFEGGGGLVVDIPIRESVGPGLAIPLLHGEVELVKDGVRIELSAEITLEIGPFAATVRRMGLQAQLPFAADEGTARAKFGFKPPSGISLAIDSSAVSGGGVLEIDVEKGRYAGALELSTKAFGISAIGLLLTKMPDGGAGWALYFSLFATFSPAIQLGFGFGLAGVGGVLAVHRRLDKEALKQVVRAGNLDAILFPGDVAKDPGRVLSTIETLFPVARGSCVFGPALKIVWGTNDMVSGKLGIYVSLPDPIVIALVGVIEVKVLGEKAEGEEEAPSLVDLRMDVGGAADLSEGTFELDARVSGKITVLELFGDMAFRARFKHKPGFLFSVGGFHPAYDPPADLRDMDRMTARIGFKKGPIDVGLTFQSYLALTSNTFQFGASIDVIAKLGGFGLEGGVYFDALVVFKPFHLTAGMGGHFSLTANGKVWLAVGVDVELDGPGPWEIRGIAHLKVLSFEVDKRFEGTIGDKQKKLSREVVDPWADLLRGELIAADNWTQEGVSAAVRTRQPTKDEAAVRWLDPAAPVTFRQRRVPLAERIERVGAEAVAKPTTLKISAARLNDATVDVSELRDEFAPADWRMMSEAEKLAAPSFVAMGCGAALGAGRRELPIGVVLSLDPEPLPIGPAPPDKPGPAEKLAARRVVPRGRVVGPTLQSRSR